MANERDQAENYAAIILPTERMDEMLDAIVRSISSAHSDHRYDRVQHHAIVTMVSYSGMTSKQEVMAKYEVMTIESEGLINDFNEFAIHVGSVAARMAPGKVMIAAWLIGQKWMIETTTATPTVINPDEHGDKDEIILVTGVSLDGRRNHAIIEINRVENNRIDIDQDSITKIYVDEESQAYSKNTIALIDEYNRIARPIMARAANS